ncbi:MAG: zinc-finger protein [Sporothrix epigloea]
MERSNQPQRGSLNYPYIGTYDNTVSSDSQSPLTAFNFTDAWKVLGLQSPQCIGQHHLSGMNSVFRTPHDDLCAHPPKCPTTGSHVNNNSGSYSHLDAGGSVSLSHMLFHTRHFDPHTLSGSIGMQGLSASDSNGYVNGLDLMDFTTTPCIPQNALQTIPPTFNNDHSEHLSVLSSPPTHTSMYSGPDDQEAGDDGDTDCDSDCEFGIICTDSACSNDPSGCCVDETCLQEQSLAPETGPDITSEDAIAAAALTSFVEQQRQHQEQQQAVAAVQAGLQAHGKHHQNESLSFQPSCLQFGLGLDTCISPQFLFNYQHLQEAHNPLNHSECTASYCPIDDPNFYEECHIRHLPESQSEFFHNIDFDTNMNETAGHSHVYTHNGNHSHDHNHLNLIECGARFANGEAMVEHLWNEHRKSLNQLQQFPASLDQMSALKSSTASSVSLSSQDLAKTPSLSNSSQYPVTGLSLSDASLSLNLGFNRDHIGGQFCESKDKAVQLRLESPTTVVPQTEVELGAFETETDHQSGAAEGAKGHCSQKLECVWCDTVDGPVCGQVFESASKLHEHVLATHTHHLKRDIGGTYSCGWLGCNRRDSQEKGGFAQKSKIDRHMQVHTGNKPFTCDVCHQSFSANQALLQHKLIHEDSKPLSCDVCGKTFRQHSALTMHIRTHTKVRPLKCPYCSKEFSESSNLSKHKRIHNGDGQYECKFPGCKRSFHRKDQLRRHSAQHSKHTLPSTIVKPLTSRNVAVNQVAV